MCVTLHSNQVLRLSWRHVICVKRRLMALKCPASILSNQKVPSATTCVAKGTDFAVGSAGDEIRLYFSCGTDLGTHMFNKIREAMTLDGYRSHMTFTP